MAFDLSYDATEERYAMALDASEFESVSTAVVAAVSTVRDSHPAALDPLTESIDPDALDGLFGVGSEKESTGLVEFAFEGHRVRVAADGRIEIRPGRI